MWLLAQKLTPGAQSHSLSVWEKSQSKNCKDISRQYQGPETAFEIKVEIYCFLSLLLNCTGVLGALLGATIYKGEKADSIQRRDMAMGKGVEGP